MVFFHQKCREINKTSTLDTQNIEKYTKNLKLEEKHSKLRVKHSHSKIKHSKYK